MRHLCTERVDRDARRYAHCACCSDDWHHARELDIEWDNLGAGACRLAANIDDVGTLLDHLLDPEKVEGFIRTVLKDGGGDSLSSQGSLSSQDSRGVGVMPVNEA